VRVDVRRSMENKSDARLLLDLLIEEANKEMDNSISIGMVRVLKNVKKRLEPEPNST
jgi:hypothetical protein